MDLFSGDDMDNGTMDYEGVATTMMITTIANVFDVTTSMGVSNADAGVTKRVRWDDHVIKPAYVNLGIFAFFWCLLLLLALFVAIIVGGCTADLEIHESERHNFSWHGNYHEWEEPVEKEFYGEFFICVDDSDEEGGKRMCSRKKRRR
jgi:hypothetical protein